MEQLMKKLDEQNITVTDYSTMVKVIQASLQRGAIRGEECSTVGRLYDKLIFQGFAFKALMMFIDFCDDDNVRWKFQSQLTMREQCRFKERKKNDKEKSL